MDLDASALEAWRVPARGTNSDPDGGSQSGFSLIPVLSPRRNAGMKPAMAFCAFSPAVGKDQGLGPSWKRIAIRFPVAAGRRKKSLGTSHSLEPEELVQAGDGPRVLAAPQLTCRATWIAHSCCSRFEAS